MNYQDSLTSFIERMLEGMERGANFAGEQIPLLVQEILIWNGVFHGAWALIGLVMVFVLARFFRGHAEKLAAWHGDWHSLDDQMRARFWNDKSNLSALQSVTVIAKYGSIGVGALLFFVNIFVTLKIILAPRLYLLEYAADLVRPASGG